MSGEFIDDLLLDKATDKRESETRNGASHLRDVDTGGGGRKESDRAR